MHSSKIFLFLLSCLFSTVIWSQKTTVYFKFKAATNERLAYASVVVMPVPDTVNKMQKLTDSTGTASFVLDQNRPYRIMLSAVGYTPIEKSITIKGDAPVYNFTASALNNSLTGVTVTSRRPLMRQEDDKTIVDPENLAASSTNAYEIIEKVPGLFVDQDGNIYLNSTTPATVHINGREQKMSATDIATMLKSLPPGSIANIEILRTPSARYDASGGGGIVNVVLKKGVRIGLTGSVAAGFNQGEYGNRFTSLNLSNSSGNLNTYLNLNYNNRNNFEQLKTDRLFAADSLLSQDALTKYGAHSYFTGFGFGYEFNKKWDISYDGRVSLNNSNNSTTNNSLILKKSTGSVSEGNLATIQNEGRNINTSHSLSLKHKIDSLGSEWTTDASYTLAPNKTDQNFTTTFPSGFKSSGNGDLENRLQFFSAQTNFVKKLSHKLTLEAGIKTTNVWFKNTTDYFRNQNGTSIKDAFRSGAYKYNEQINAAYLQASKTIYSITIKAGTRLESTNMKGVQQVPKDTSFNINRTDFFPYLYISRNLMKIAGYDLRAYLVYRRTINRPAYEYLNPSIRYVDPYLFETGNPSLRPQFTNNYEANVSFEERPILAIGYNDTKDIFTNVVYPTDTSSKLSYRTYDNLGTNKETYFRALGALPPGGKYFFVAGVQYNQNFYEGLYENKPLSFKKGSWTIFTYHTLKITPLMLFSFNGFIRLDPQQQFYELSNFGALRVSLSQQFLNKKLTATLVGEDILRTNKNEFTINQGSINASGLRRNDTQRFGLNIRYNLGFRKKEESNMFNVDPQGGN